MWGWIGSVRPGELTGIDVMGFGTLAFGRSTLISNIGKNLMMAIKKIVSYEVQCDYPMHSQSSFASLSKNTQIHQIYSMGIGYIVCDNCWQNKLTVETLLDLIGVTYNVFPKLSDLDMS